MQGCIKSRYCFLVRFAGIAQGWEVSRYSLGRAWIDAIFGSISVSASQFLGIECAKDTFAYTSDTLNVSTSLETVSVSESPTQISSIGNNLDQNSKIAQNVVVLFHHKKYSALHFLSNIGLSASPSKNVGYAKAQRSLNMNQRGKTSFAKNEYLNRRKEKGRGAFVSCVCPFRPVVIAAIIFNFTNI